MSAQSRSWLVRVEQSAWRRINLTQKHCYMPISLNYSQGGWCPSIKIEEVEIVRITSLLKTPSSEENLAFTHFGVIQGSDQKVIGGIPDCCELDSGVVAFNWMSSESSVTPNALRIHVNACIFIRNQKDWRALLFGQLYICCWILFLFLCNHLQRLWNIYQKSTSGQPSP